MLQPVAVSFKLRAVLLEQIVVFLELASSDTVGGFFVQRLVGTLPDVERVVGGVKGRLNIGRGMERGRRGDIVLLGSGNVRLSGTPAVRFGRTFALVALLLPNLLHAGRY